MTRSEVRPKQGSTHVENMNAARMTLIWRPLPMEVIRKTDWPFIAHEHACGHEHFAGKRHAWRRINAATEYAGAVRRSTTARKGNRHD